MALHLAFINILVQSELAIRNNLVLTESFLIASPFLSVSLVFCLKHKILVSINIPLWRVVILCGVSYCEFRLYYVLE